jgi:hypothetical protein
MVQTGNRFWTIGKHMFSVQMKMRSELDYRNLFDERLKRPPAGLLDARTTLRHFG